MKTPAALGHFIPMKAEDVEPRTMQAVKTYIDGMPDFPIHVHKLLNIVYDIDKDAKDLTKLISTDPILVSKILQRVNSSFYSLRKRVDDLKLAISILGFFEIRNIAVQYGVSHVFGKDGKHGLYSFKQLWEHAYLVSICEHILSPLLLPEKVGEVNVLGLLHDIGKFALEIMDILLLQKHDLGEVSLPNQVEVCSLEYEERCFGINHSIVGGLLARKWNLSERTCVVLEYHHVPSYFSRNHLPREFQEEIILTCLTDFFVNLFEGRLTVPLLLNTYRNKFLIDDEMKESLWEKLKKEKEFLNCIID